MSAHTSRSFDLALHEIPGMTWRMTGQRDRTNARIEFDISAERLEAAGRDVGRDGCDCGVEECAEEGRCFRLVGRVQPVVGFDLACPYDRVRERHGTVRNDATDMVLVQMCQQHLVDLLELIARRAQVRE